MEQNPVRSRDDVSYTSQRKIESVESLYQATSGLLERVDLVSQVVHNAKVADLTDEAGPFSEHPLRDTGEIPELLARTIPPLERLRNALQTELILARMRVSGVSPEPAEGQPADPFEPLREAIPRPDSAELIDLEVDLDRLVQATVAYARNQMAAEATEIYNQAARAVASINEEDPRANLAELLVDSLVTVGRYPDARAAVVLLPADNRRQVALGRVAGAMGRRGLVTAGAEWIDALPPGTDRERLYRRMEDGLLNTIDENRLRRSLRLPGD